MYCPNCGASNRDTSKFCSRCGTTLKGAGAPAGASPGLAPASPPQVSSQPSRPAPSPPPASLQPSRPAPATQQPVSLQPSRPAPAPGVPAQDRHPQPAPLSPPRHATQTISFDRLKHKNLVIAILAAGIFIIVLGAIFVAWLLFRPTESDFDKAQAAEPPGDGLFLFAGNNLERMEKISSQAELGNADLFPILGTNHPVFVIQLENLKSQKLILAPFDGQSNEIKIETGSGKSENSLVFQPKETLSPGPYCLGQFDAQNNWRAFWCFSIE